jgi:hypothetical protein
LCVGKPELADIEFGEDEDEGTDVYATVNPELVSLRPVPVESDPVPVVTAPVLDLSPVPILSAPAPGGPAQVPAESQLPSSSSDDEHHVLSNSEEEEGQVIMRRGERIREARVIANVGQDKSCKKMMQLNKKVIKNVKVGDLVLLSVPDVDRGPLDPSNLVCFVLAESNTLFQLGCRAGVLNSFYAFNSFRKCELVSEFTIADIPKVVDKNGRATADHVKMV